MGFELRKALGLIALAALGSFGFAYVKSSYQNKQAQLDAYQDAKAAAHRARVLSNKPDLNPITVPYHYATGRSNVCSGGCADHREAEIRYIEEGTSQTLLEDTIAAPDSGLTVRMRYTHAHDAWLMAADFTYGTVRDTAELPEHPDNGPDRLMQYILGYYWITRPWLGTGCPHDRDVNQGTILHIHCEEAAAASLESIFDLQRHPEARRYRTIRSYRITARQP